MRHAREAGTPPSQAPAAAPATAGSIQLYFAPCAPEDPNGIDDALLAFLASARSDISCAFYELSLESAADVLIQKHAAGVRVAIVSDSDYEDRDAIQRCNTAGIPVVFDQRSGFMHNKFCIIDGRAVWTGSTNITENGMFHNDNNALRIDSAELAADYLAEFQEMFAEHAFGGRSPRNPPFPVLDLGGIPAACYFSPEDDPIASILAEVNAAASSIDFLAFSFTSTPLAEAMAARIHAGVRVRGVFEARGAGSRYSRDDYLREHGAAVFMDTNPDAMHHKVIIIDNTVVITGSYNFSKSAETENDENVLILRAEPLARRYTEEFEHIAGYAP